MRFGFFYELQLPSPWTEQSQEDLIHHALEQLELADLLGFHSVWEVEHHFLEEYSPVVPADYTVQALAKPLVEARGGHELVEKLAGDSAIGIPRPRDLQEHLQNRRRN